MTARRSRLELADLAPRLVARERERGDVDVQLLAGVLRGGKAENARRKEVERLVAEHPVLGRRREYAYQNHTQRYYHGLEKAFHFARLLQRHGDELDAADQQSMYVALGERLPLDVHRAMFIPTLENQGDAEQQRQWLPLAKSFRILGAYAQTELGHGSNVQGIETTAEFDRASQEFVLHSPTLTSRKWWPGGLGKTCTHAIVHAKLLIDGESKGVQAFLVQLRSLKDHQPLPGVDMGDIGPKVGFNSLDNGYAAFDHVRIPRRQMLMRFAQVTPEGEFRRPANDKLVYLTMLQVRAYLILKLSFNLGAAVTIATRFSVARLQGHKSRDATEGTSGDSGVISELAERQVLDYQNQQHGLFPLLALAYAANFAGRALAKQHDDTLAAIKQSGGRDADSFSDKLAELHAVASGLKAWLANRANDGIEHCRRLCGGLGFLQSSNLAHLFAENVGAVTFEGTFDVLVQQHARYLIKNHQAGSQKHLKCTAKNVSDFGNLDVLLDAFRFRAWASLERLVQAVNATSGTPSVNPNMTLMAAASVAYTELALLEAFVTGVRVMAASPTRESVEALCALFGAWLLTQDMGSFRDHDYVSSAQGEMARQLVLRQLPVVRANAVRLTDAFDFSDFELNSTIGRFDGDMYRALVAEAAHEPLNRTQVPEGFQLFIKPLLQSAL
jgi:acyl-CoA oxidase